MPDNENALPADYDPERWHVQVCGLPGENFDQYFYETKDLLELCGRALYGNSLFEQLLLLRICHRNQAKREFLGYEYVPIDGVKVEWKMKSLDAHGSVSYRLFESRHEAFAMLVAQIKLGATIVEVYRKDNCCPKE